MSGYDDEPTIKELGDWAAAALQSHCDERNGGFGDTYGDEGSGPFGDAVADLLAGLMHLTERAGIEFNEELSRARVIYRNEQRYNRPGGE